MTTSTRPQVAPTISRFRRAQDKQWHRIARELAVGRKEGHWMWFAFPKLRPLAKSETAHYYGLDGKAEALAYLDDPVLRRRLAEGVTAVLRHRRLMFDATDANRFRSSITLFRELVTDPTLLDAVLRKFYNDTPCQLTLDVLAGHEIPVQWVKPKPVRRGWGGTAQGRVEWGGVNWEAQVRKAQRRTAGAGPMSPREIRQYLLRLGLSATVTEMVADRWIEDQNEATQQGWEARDAEN